jgi:hypothetical protein
LTYCESVLLLVYITKKWFADDKPLNGGISMTKKLFSKTLFGALLVLLLSVSSQSQAMSALRSLSNLSVAKMSTLAQSRNLWCTMLPTGAILQKSIRTYATKDNRPEDSYTTLGISHNATTAEIKKAFYAKAKQEHPDRSKKSDAKERFQKLQDAYATLSDQHKRQEYDFTTRRNLETQQGSSKTCSSVKNTNSTEDLKHMNDEMENFVKQTTFFSAKSSQKTSWLSMFNRDELPWLKLRIQLACNHLSIKWLLLKDRFSKKSFLK